MGQVAARRVLVAGDERLLCETIATALEERGFDVCTPGSPGAEDSTVGLLMSTLSTGESVAAAVDVIHRHGLPWVVVGHVACEDARTTLLAAGACVVLSSDASVADTEAALDQVLEGRPLSG